MLRKAHSILNRMDYQNNYPELNGYVGADMTLVQIFSKVAVIMPSLHCVHGVWTWWRAWIWTVQSLNALSSLLLHSKRVGLGGDVVGRQRNKTVSSLDH